MKMNQNRWLTAGLWLNAVLLGWIGFTLASRSGGITANIPELMPMAMAQPAQGPIAGGAGLFLMPAQFSSNTWGCYVMDVDSQTLCAYQFLPGDKQLRLIAARNFRFDRRLGNYNTLPAPLDVKDLVEKEGQTNRIGGE